MHPAIQNRVRGCAVGAAIGDALGMPLEFGPPSPENALVREMQDGRMPAGSFTDDTEMALALAESLLFQKPLDPDDLIQRFVAWFRTHPPDIGIQTNRILSWLAAGHPFEEVLVRTQLEMPDSAGNGSLMRCWPVALAWLQGRSERIADTRLQSQITHPHPDCQAACVFTNLMIVDLIQGVPKQEAFQAALQSVELSDNFRQLIENAPRQQRKDLQNTGWVRHTLESAIWGLMNTTSFSEAVVQVANLGQDADTAASVTGALAGAAYGLNAIPAAWQEQLQGQWPPHSGDRLRTDDFIRIADALAGVE
ncbi:MAG: ADP-ribosylglycohydrolase family protein [Anaerolineaceae bacterium]|jgi:ADP-ribosyl-[dinitrogen reductase] hydrolase|nr:ADP-ribosylglycohydrolase family protein [Anaerolineaceae bacterium]